MLHALKLNTYRDKLHALRARLDSQAARLRGESSHSAGTENTEGFASAPGDPVDRASQQIEVEVSIHLAENEAVLRTEIDAALERIRDATFGICAECGASIGVNRLDSIPYARFCIRCERRIEEEMKK